MKIAMVLEKWGFGGGREQHNISMLRALLEKGHKCSLVYGSQTDKPVDEELFFPVNIYCDPALSVYSHPDDKKYLNTFLSFMDQEKPDVVYLERISNLETLRQIAQKWPSIVTVHDLWLVCIRVSKTSYFRRKPCLERCGIVCLLHGCFLGKSRRVRGLLRYNSLRKLLSVQSVYKKFDAIIVPSRFAGDTLVENGFKMMQIHAFGYFNEHTPMSTTAVPANGNILFVGRIDRYKGVDVLLQAIRKCKTSARLVIIGDGPFLPKVRRIAVELGIENRVDFRGWISHKDLSMHYANATVVVVPSLCPDVFPKVGLEAMSHSRPIIAFDVGGIGEWLHNGENGFLVPWKDINAMACMIDKMYQNIELSKRMGDVGRETVLKEFSKETYLDRLEKVLLDTISNFKREYA